MDGRFHGKRRQNEWQLGVPLWLRKPPKRAIIALNCRSCMFFLVSYGLTQSCLVPLLTAFPQAFPLFTALSRVRRAVPLAPQQLFKVEDQGTEPLGQPEQWLLPWWLMSWVMNIYQSAWGFCNNPRTGNPELTQPGCPGIIEGFWIVLTWDKPRTPSKNIMSFICICDCICLWKGWNFEHGLKPFIFALGG